MLKPTIKRLIAVLLAVFMLILCTTGAYAAETPTEDEQPTHSPIYFGDIRVAVGDKGSLEEKIQMLTSILPQLQGQKGLLNMKSYDQGLENITFTQE